MATFSQLEGPLSISYMERHIVWEALNVFDWWSLLAGLDLADPTAIGLKADIGERLRGGHLERMRNYFMRLTWSSLTW